MQKRSTGIYLGFLLAVTMVLLMNPGHNGDMPFYISLMIEQETGKKNPLEETKAVLEKELPESEYIEHASRIELAGDGIMDYYRIKPLYIQICLLFHKLGFSYIFSTLLPSLIAYFLIGCITFKWASKVMAIIPAIFVSAFLMLSDASVVIARLSTPDGLSNLFILASLYAVYFNKNKPLVYALLLLSIFLRIDNLVAVLVILIGWRYWPPSGNVVNRPSGINVAIWCLAAISIAVLMNYWLTEDKVWMKSITYIQGAKDYGRQVMLYLRVINGGFMMSLLIFGAIIHFIAPFSRRQPQGYLLLIIGTIIFLRFLLFPSPEARFMTAFYIVATLVLTERLNLAAKSII